MDEAELVRRLRDRTALRYMGDCKCGQCQLVAREDLLASIDAIERLVRERDEALREAPLSGRTLGRALANKAAADATRRVVALEAEAKRLVRERDEAKEVLAFVETWVCNPASAYSVYALDGLFGITRDRIAALTASPSPPPQT